MSLARVRLALLLVAFTPGVAAARDASDCAAAATAAERDWMLPDHLLLAIGLAETGLRDPSTGQFRPEAYSVNVAGTDVVFATPDYAVGAVAALQARGVRSIDVGCFQINLQHHPGAFSRLPDAFDPSSNARYAGGFLRRLFERFGDWGTAVANYHSADPTRGGPYRDRVFRFWNGLGHPPVGVAVSRILPIPVYTPATLPAWLRRRLPSLLQGGLTNR